MIRHHLIQGTPEWHAFRANHYGASEAAVMMGVHPNIKRNELLHMKATGTEKEYSDWVQRNLFDKGHKIEAILRPKASELIGDELFPVTCSEGSMSSSYDGLTMLADDHWECKMINEGIRAAETAEELALYYRVQLEQQLHVRGGERCLFSAGAINESDEVIEEKHLWYTADLELRAQIIAGWEQFEKDVAAYVPKEIVEAPNGSPVMSLPAVSVQVSGSIAVVDNFEKFGAALHDFVERKLIRDPKTDQDFADLDEQVKELKKAEDALDAAEAQLLAQIESVDTLKRTKDLLHKLARDNRLMAEKLVKAKKAQIKDGIVMEGRNAFMDHMNALNAEIVPVVITNILPDFNGVIKNKRTLASLHDAVDTELARVKILADQRAKEIRENLTFYREAAKGHEFLFADLAVIGQKAHDDFKATVNLRISQHQEAERQRREAEAAAAKAEDEKVPETAPAVAETVAEEPEVPAPAALVNTKASAPGNGTETVLVIRHAFTDQFMRAKVEECLAEYGVMVESVELMGGVREVAA